MLHPIAIVTLCLATFSAQGALLGRAPFTPGGTDYQAYYNDVLNITWVADANLAATTSFGASGIDAEGHMAWAAADAWIGAMNQATYLGTSEWRLPTVTDTGPPGCIFFDYSGSDCGYTVDVSTGEMAHLYYSTLGNLAAYDSSGVLRQEDWGLISQGPFAHIQPYFYWYGTESAQNASQAWYFIFYDGFQLAMGKHNQFYAWPVRDGDIAVVPAPGAIWLLGTAIGAIGWLSALRTLPRLPGRL